MPAQVPHHRNSDTPSLPAWRSPSDVSPVEVIDASLGPLSELAARVGLSIEYAAALVAARARSHTAAGGAAGDMAPRGLISDLVGELKESVPEAVSDAIDWGKSQISYYKCVAKCIFKYKAVSSVWAFGSGRNIAALLLCLPPTSHPAAATVT